MKLQIKLSIKNTLCFALPCLASTLLFTACSNDASEPTTVGSEPATSGIVRFTASVPTSDAVTTRIGIDDVKKPTIENYLVDEPVIWLEDDKVSVFFVPERGGDVVHAQFKVDKSTLSTDKQSTDLVNVDDLSYLDGNYTIYAFTPYKETNKLDLISLDLSNQFQAVNHNNYSHLGSTASMRSKGVGATFTNGSTSTNVNFDFEHIASFLRFHIKNGLNENVNVTGISLTHPNMFAAATYNAASNVLTAGTSGSTISLSFGEEGKSLESDGSFDAYMSAFPVSMTSNFDKELGLIFTFDDGTKMSLKPTPSDLGYSVQSGMFAAGTRFFFDITLSKDAPLPPVSSITYDGYYYTYDKVNTSLSNIFYLGDKPFVNFTDLPNACPSGYTSVHFDDLRGYKTPELNQLRNALGSEARGYLNSQTGNVSQRDVLLFNCGPLDQFMGAIYSEGFIGFLNVNNNTKFRPICRRPII